MFNLIVVDKMCGLKICIFKFCYRFSFIRFIVEQNSDHKSFIFGDNKNWHRTKLLNNVLQEIFHIMYFI